MWHPNQTITGMMKTGNLWGFVRSHPLAPLYLLPGYVIFLFSITPVLLSIFGIWVMRKNWRALTLLLTITVYFAAVHIVFFTAPKSLMPGSLAYIILSAIALDYFYSKINDRTIVKIKSAVSQS